MKEYTIKEFKSQKRGFIKSLKVTADNEITALMEYCHCSLMEVCRFKTGEYYGAYTSNRGFNNIYCVID